MIGVIAIVVGETLPDSIDAAMGRVVGVTLVLLGLYVIYALLRYREDFRLRSRWMLVFAGVRKLYRSIRNRRQVRQPVTVGGGSDTHGAQTRTPDARPHDPFVNYGTGTSLAVGALHGIGAETPTQVLIFLAAAGAGGTWAGLVTLGMFLVGLFAANTLLAVVSASGYLAAPRAGSRCMRRSR